MNQMLKKQSFWKLIEKKSLSLVSHLLMCVDSLKLEKFLIFLLLWDFVQVKCSKIFSNSCYVLWMKNLIFSNKHKNVEYKKSNLNISEGKISCLKCFFDDFFFKCVFVVSFCFYIYKNHIKTLLKKISFK